MLMPSKKHIFWLTLIALGLASGLSMAASTPLSAPMVPAQSTAPTPPLEVGSSTPLNVEVKEAEGQVSVKAGDVLHTGDTVKTENGSCHLLIDGKAELFLAPFTTLRITEALRNDADKTESTRLEVDFGRLKIKLAQLKGGSKFELNTPAAVAVVRGTTLFLNITDALSQLYVDETHGGVFFKNTLTGKSFLVPAFSLSTSFKDGSINEPKGLTKEQQEEFLKNWQDPSSNASGQFGVEEIPLPPASLPDLPSGPDSKLDDAARDRLLDQIIAGANGFALQAPLADEEAPPANEETPPTDTPSPTDLEEQSMIRREIALIRGDQDFDHADANLERISDAKTGKVFTDVFGNRVRTDQYIFLEPGTGFVEFLSLTARTGEYQNGVSSVLFGTLFNQPLAADTDLRSLPWNDYMHVVTKDDVASNLGILPGTPDYDDLYNEYILHEHNPALAEGESGLFPLVFVAEFTNPNQDSVLFGDAFSSPFSLDLQGEGGPQSVLAQGKLAETTLVAPSSGGTVQWIGGYQTGEFISVDSGPFVPLLDENGNDGGSQTASFAENFTASKLLDINYYRNLPVNSDGDPLNDEHPAYFDTPLNDRLDVSEAVIGRNRLIGALVPIDDQGQIIDQLGFTVEGLRGLLSPNPLVNGGNYNLEVLFLYGYVDNSGGNGLFHEDFRIDTIITPEIFTDFYSQQSSAPSIFPPALRLDDDDEAIDPQV